MRVWHMHVKILNMLIEISQTRNRNMRAWLSKRKNWQRGHWFFMVECTSGSSHLQASVPAGLSPFVYILRFVAWVSGKNLSQNWPALKPRALCSETLWYAPLCHASNPPLSMWVLLPGFCHQELLLLPLCPPKGRANCGMLFYHRCISFPHRGS